MRSRGDLHREFVDFCISWMPKKVAESRDR
jgi:hypothetical protein